MTTTSTHVLNQGFRIDTWQLELPLLAEIHIDDDSVIASTVLNETPEYGSGQTLEEALCDLVVSLGEYREALESRRERLGNSSMRDLELLERLLKFY